MINTEDDFSLFQPTETERSDLLAKLSDDILLTNIDEQLKTVILNNLHHNDMLAIFENRFQFILNFYPDDEIIIERCKEIKKNLYQHVYEVLVNRFSISSDLEDYVDSDDFYFYTRELYNFLVLKYKENIINFFISYLYKNKKALIEPYSNDEKKDLMFKSLKKSISKPENVMLLYHVEDIINNFAQYSDEPESIIEEIISTDEYEATNFAIKELFLDNRFETYLDKAFITEFFKPVEDEESQYDIYSSIRNELILLVKIEEARITVGNKKKD